MSYPAQVLLAAAAIATHDDLEEGTTPFAYLSDEAKDLIVRSACGEFDNCPPPPMSDEVRAEIKKWCQEED